MVIQAYTEGDRQAVIDLWHRCGLVVPHNDPARDIDFCLTSGHGRIFVGRLDEELMATIMTGHDGHRGWLYYLAVSPDRRDQGLGRAIVAHAEDWLRGQGAPKVQLMVRDINTAVVGFYESIGYDIEPRVILAKRFSGTAKG
jgi:ribosomal protein S18 acetylase RimI-like enzyme